MYSARKRMSGQGVERFIDSWRGKPVGQVVEEMASMAMESRRKPDSYYFWMKDGKLISPETGLPVEFSISVETDLDRREKEVFLRLQDWAVGASEGAVIWISPPHRERSEIRNGVRVETAKIIVSEIIGEGVERKVENTAIVMDISAEECYKMANRLSQNRFKDSEAVRDGMFKLVATAESGSDWWFDWLEYALESEGYFDEVRRNWRKDKQIALDQAVKYQRMMEAGFKPPEIVDAMEKDGFMGRNVLSCPAGPMMSASETLMRHSRVYSGEKKILNCRCPSCRRQVEAEIYGGRIYCPECKASAPYVC